MFLSLQAYYAREFPKSLRHILHGKTLSKVGVLEVDWKEEPRTQFQNDNTMIMFTSLCNFLLFLIYE